LLPPLDAPHHVRKHEWSKFREGVTLEGDPSKGTLVDVGLSKNVLVEQILEPGKRVTVAMGTNRDLTTACVRKVVPPSTLREEMGSYWGYKVRYASSLSGVFKNSPYKEEYDHVIGTSEHGQIINSSELTLPSFRYTICDPHGLPYETNLDKFPSIIQFYVLNLLGCFSFIEVHKSVYKKKP